jgi:Coenzyme PQQ synthesis protein D (PqqD)
MEGTLLVRSSGMLTRSFADETLIAVPHGGDVDRLTASAAVVWDLLQEPRAFDDLIAILHSAYDVPEEVVACDVESFVCELIDRGCVLEIRDVDD